MDMEWNQALTYSEMVKDPVFLTGEIIQIGAIKLNQALEVVDSFNEQIAPQYYTELHLKVAEITKLSNRDLQKGKGFHTVFNSFCDWCGDDFVFLVSQTARSVVKQTGCFVGRSRAAVSGGRCVLSPPDCFVA